jgi:hypothetical protein
MIINPTDTFIIQQAIMKNVPPNEQQTAQALLNIGIAFIQLAERFVVAHESIANELAKANKLDDK